MNDILDKPPNVTGFEAEGWGIAPLMDFGVITMIRALTFRRNMLSIFRWLHCVQVVYQCIHLNPPSQHSVNKMHYIVPIYFILQYHIEHCYMFRSLMGSSSGNLIKVTFHKTELAIYAHRKRSRKVNQFKCRCLLHDGSWCKVVWRQPACLRKDKTVLSCPPSLNVLNDKHASVTTKLLSS